MIQEVGGLSVSGGGLGLHNGIRATSNKAPGPIPYMKVLDSTIGYFRREKHDSHDFACDWESLYNELKKGGN
jgi:hypothetical protein